MSSLFDKTSKALATTIDMTTLRNNVIGSNIANHETPGYKAKKLDFESALARALDIEGKGRMHTSNGNHFAVGQGPISRVRADIYDNPDVNVTNDGNTVDLENEMAKLAENTILNEAATRLINKKLATMRYVASDGGR